MKTRRWIFFILMLAIAGITPTTLHAQAVAVSGPQFRLIALAKPSSLQPGEVACGYFLWTKDFTPDQRVSFNYVDQKGSVTGDVPALRNVTIVINPANDIPVAVMVGTDDREQTIWQLSMSRGTYDANGKCLIGVTIKNMQ
jgi:hypothetical protein